MRIKKFKQCRCFEKNIILPKKFPKKWCYIISTRRENIQKCSAEETNICLLLKQSF